MRHLLPANRNTVAFAKNALSRVWLAALAMPSRDNPNWLTCFFSRLLIFGVSAVFATGCAKERGVPPTNLEYVLFVSIHGASPRIDVLNLGTKVVEGRIETSGTGATGILRTTIDSKYLVSFMHRSQLKVFDTRTQQMISSVSTNAFTLAVQSNPPVVVTSKFLGWTVVYNLPNLDTLAVFRPWLLHLLPSTNPGEVLGIGLSDPSGTPGPTGPLQLLRIALPSGKVLDSVEFVSPATGGGVTTNIWSFSSNVDWNSAVVLSPDGSRLYMAGLDDAGPALFCFDIYTGTCLFRTQGIERRPFVSADGREVWVPQNKYSSAGDSVISGTILFLDGNTGNVADSLSTSGLDHDVPGGALPMGHVEFHPDKPEAYVSIGMKRPGLLVINTESKAVTAMLYDSTLTPVGYTTIGQEY